MLPCISWPRGQVSHLTCHLKLCAQQQIGGLTFPLCRTEQSTLRLQLSEGHGDVQMLTGQVRMHKCVFEMSSRPMRLVVGTKGSMAIVCFFLNKCRCGKYQQISNEGMTSQFYLGVLKCVAEFNILQFGFVKLTSITTWNFCNILLKQYINFQTAYGYLKALLQPHFLIQ